MEDTLGVVDRDGALAAADQLREFASTGQGNASGSHADNSNPEKYLRNTLLDL